MKRQSVIISVLLALLCIGAIGVSVYRVRWEADGVIAEHVQLIAQSIEQIHKDCTILSLEHTKNFVDFLNVISFYGSEVGPLNLVHPEKWQGPYLKDNPTMQEKYYQILKAQDGYFVVPGTGVRLSNGLVIDKDIILNEHAEVQKLIQNGTLRSKLGKPLAQEVMQKHYVKPILTDV